MQMMRPSAAAAAAAVDSPPDQSSPPTTNDSQSDPSSQSSSSYNRRANPRCSKLAAISNEEIGRWRSAILVTSVDDENRIDMQPLVDVEKLCAFAGHANDKKFASAIDIISNYAPQFALETLLQYSRSIVQIPFTVPTLKQLDHDCCFPVDDDERRNNAYIYLWFAFIEKFDIGSMFKFVAMGSGDGPAFTDFMVEWLCVDAVMDTLSQAYIDKFWQSEYSGNGLDNLLSYLESVHATLNPSTNTTNDHVADLSQTRYTNAIPIIQSSGSGKSFTVKSLALKNVFVAYLHVKEHRNAYPYASPVIVRYQALIKTNPAKSGIVFACLLATLIEVSLGAMAHRINPKYFVKIMIPRDTVHDSPIWTWIQERLDALFQIMSTTSVALEDQHTGLKNHFQALKFFLEELRTSKVSMRNNRLEKQEHSISVPSLANYHQSLAEDNINENEMVVQDLKIRKKVSMVIVVDEVSAISHSEKMAPGLMESFRRSLRLIPKNINVIICDTISNVDDISPPAYANRSARAREADARTFDPFYWLPIVTHKISANIADFKSLVNYDLFQIGRPLWGAYDGLDRLDIAQLKIIGGLENWTCDTLPTHTKIALIACRVPFQIVNFDLSNNLIANNMQYAFHIDQHRRTIISSYLSEPVLAEAAKQHFMEQKGLLEISLKEIASYMRAGAIERGTRGEISLMIVLLIAFDDAARGFRLADGPPAYLPYCNASAFFEKLLSKDAVQYIKSTSDRYDTFVAATSSSLNGIIFFNHFVKLRVTPDPSHLLEMFKHDCAGWTKTNQPGMDIIIPVLLPGSDGAFRLLPENMSWISIECKNRSGIDENFDDSSGARMSAYFTGVDEFPRNPYWTLYCSLGSPKSYPSFNLEASQRHHANIENSSERHVSIADFSLDGVSQSKNPSLSRIAYAIQYERGLDQNKRDEGIYLVMDEFIKQNPDAALNQFMVRETLKETFCPLPDPADKSKWKAKLSVDRRIIALAYNRYRQMSVVTFGLRTETFPCLLNPSVLDYLKTISESSTDPAAVNSHAKDAQIEFAHKSLFPMYGNSDTEIVHDDDDQQPILRHAPIAAKRPSMSITKSRKRIKNDVKTKTDADGNSKV